ncbi:hypothetical protein JCM10213_004968 [Rhodosporidiobolus nylandii]
MASAAGSLVPRVYQEEALAAALERNVVVRADTGAGKTLISILLIRQLALNASPGALAVFITPTVSLVHQQASALRTHLALRVKEFVGADGVDFWQREKWQKQLSEAEVIVMTPQIFLDVLSKAYWPLDKVFLIVFDEAHHASKRHPYAEIMRQHYHLSTPDRRPRILGLTASPIWQASKPAKAKQAISELEAILDCRILEVGRTHRDEMAAHAPKAVERLVQHAPQPAIPDQEGDQLIQRLRREILLEEKWETRLEDALVLFGPAGVEILVHQLAKEHGVSPAFLAELDILVSKPVASSSLSKKVQALVEVLAMTSPADFHAIVFVEQRHHAQVLSNLLSRIPSLAPWLRPGALIGHGGRGRPDLSSAKANKETGMAIKEQTAVVAAFRSGDLNLLVATRIAEEGLDFRQCNLVVRFDALTTITGYVQSRGRARKADALFVVLAEEGSADAERYEDYVEQEAQLQTMYAERPLDDDEQQEPELDDLPNYTTRAGALLTHQSAIPTLAQFCQLIRFDAFTPLQKPHYTVSPSGLEWTAELRVPRATAFSTLVFRSPPMPTKKSAKQRAAFDACIDLHRTGGLDDHLLPFREVTGKGAKDADGRVIDRNILPKSVEVTVFNPFGNAYTRLPAYLHIFELCSPSAVSRLGLVCGSPEPGLASGVIYSREGREIRVRVQRIVELHWAVAAEQAERLRLLNEFNRDCTRIVLNRRIEDERFFALWAPVTDAGEVDWDAVEGAFSPFDAEKVKPGDLVVVPFRRPSKRIGSFSCVRSDVTSSSPSLDVEVDPPAKKIKALQRYTNYWLYANIAYGCNLDFDSHDAIVEFDPLDLEPYNALIPPQPDYQAVRSASRRLRTFPSTMVRRTSLSLEFWQNFALIPSLNHLITSRLHAASALSTFHFPSIDVERLAEAFTLPSCGTGRSYETLEFVGDSVLKFATSVHIYLEYSAADEDRMTRLRENSVDNRGLRRRSLDTGLASFLIPHSFRSATFIPVSSDDATLSEDGLKITKQLPRRVLSDTMEATLGAALATGGVGMAIATGDKLGLCFGGTTPWQERPSAKPLLEVEPQLAGVGLKGVEAAIGYQFKSQGRLLAQALTHRSYAPSSPYSWEREEYLGDAILDIWATMRLYSLFPSATPRNLTYKRAILVANSSLALLAIRKLDAHRVVLHSSPALERALMDAAEMAEKFSYEDAVQGSLTWMWTPPKVLGDVFEALLAVVFIDCGMKLDPVFAVLDRLYQEVMPYLSETEVRDPHSRFLMQRDAWLCQELSLKVTRIDPSTSSPPGDTASAAPSGLATPSVPTPPSPSPLAATGEPYFTASAFFHSAVPLCPPSMSTSKAVARQLAAREALEVLKGMEERGEVERMCSCRKNWEKDRREARAALRGRADRQQEDEGGDEDESEETPSLAPKKRPEDEEEESERDVDEERAEEQEKKQEEERVFPTRIREY